MGKYIGTVSRGIKLPIIKNGEVDILDVIFETLKNASGEIDTPFKNNDVICITESIVARANDNYVSVDDIANDIRSKFGDNCELIILYPIYSRNRFSMILKGFARASSKIHIFINDGKDEVGNDIINPFTGIDIEKFYREVVESENCICEIHKNKDDLTNLFVNGNKNIIQCKCHPEDRDIFIMNERQYTLADICSEYSEEHGYNEEYGLLGSNKATEEKLKLFPNKSDCKLLCESLKKLIDFEYGIDVNVMVYGDGCFKDPVGGIWEFADPVVSPYYTEGLNGTPNEIKIKYIADNESNDLSYIKEKITNKDKNLKGNMLSQGTTPRRYTDLIGSLADLTSGSGDKGTPVVWISGYFDNYSTE